MYTKNVLFTFYNLVTGFWFLLFFNLMPEESRENAGYGRFALHPLLTLSLIVGLTVSTIGDEIYLAVMVLQLESITSSGLVIAIFLASQLLPRIFLSPIAGQIIDRFETSRVLVITQIAQAALLLFLAQIHNPIILLFGAFILGALFSLSQPALYTLLPVIAEKSRVRTNTVNAIVEFFSRSAMLIGPAIGGLLFESSSASMALLIDAATFVIAALIVLLLGVRRQAAQTGQQKKLFAGAMAGIKILMQNPILRITIITICLGYVAMSLVNVAFVFLVREVLGGSGGTYGVLYAMWGLGMLIGSVIAARRQSEAHLEEPVLIGLMFIGVSLLFTGLFPVVIMVALNECFGGIANGIHNVALRTTLHTQVNKDYHGRVFAAFGALNSTAIMTGYLLGSPFAASYTLSVYLVAGISTAALSLMGLILVLRLKPGRL